MAATGVIIMTGMAVWLLHLQIDFLPIAAIAVLILAYNAVFSYYHRFVESRKQGSDLLRDARAFANVQISMDLLSLGLLIHFTGGIESPFAFYFVFHMAIGSILLPRKNTLMQCALALAVMGAIAGLEYAGTFDHHHIVHFGVAEDFRTPTYVALRLFVLATSLLLIVYFTTSISRDLSRRGLELEDANRKLAQQDKLKSEYVFRVTHDIQAHLAAIHGCLSPVASGMAGKVDSTQKDLILRAKCRTEKMLKFVKSLLRLTSAKLKERSELSEVSLADVVAKSVEVMREDARRKSVTLECSLHDGYPVSCDESALEEVVIALLSNAVKYTPPGGRIRIDTQADERRVRVSLSDNGIGIPSEDIGRVFEEFYRSCNAREAERDGTGLGLAIAKYIVERHGGRIWVNSEGVGKGSTFAFELDRSPMKRPDPA